MCVNAYKDHQSNLQRMQDIAQRRQASLQYYREQYDSAHVQPSAAAARQVDNRYTDGEDEIDCAGIRREADDEVDSVQTYITRTNISSSSSPPNDHT